MTKNLNEALKFFEINDVPSDMKLLNTMYKKLALKYHPDKNNGEEKFTELYKELQHHYKQIGEHIKSQKAHDKASGDEEADEYCDIFSHFNFAGYYDKKNLISHTIIIRSDTGPLWQTVLERQYGPPEQALETGGFKFRVKGFGVDDGGHDIFVTCYPRTKEPKLFIQSKSQYGNDIYVTNELPRLFSEVNKEASRGSLGVAGAGAQGAGVGPAAGPRGGRQGDCGGSDLQAAAVNTGRR